MGERGEGQNGEPQNESHDGRDSERCANGQESTLLDHRDLNGLPQDFDVLAKLCAQGDHHDVGALRAIAGADKDGPTCCPAAQEEGNSRDFVLASTTALSLVVILSIDKEGTFQTHKPVMTELRTNTLKTRAKMKMPGPGMRRGSWTFGV